MKVLIVGGGIGGLALGVALGRRGIVADIVEKRPAYGEEGAGIILGPNHMAVMKGLGLDEAVIAAGHGIEDACIADASGKVLQRAAYRVEGLPWPGTAIHRTALQEILRSGLPVPVRVGTAVTGLTHVGWPVPATSGMPAGSPERSTNALSPIGVGPEGPPPVDHGVDVALSDGSTARYDVVVGADGIRSTVREAVCGPVQPRYSGYTCWRFVVDGHHGSGTVEMWGRGKRVGVVLLGGRRTYVFLTLNADRRAPAPWTDLDGLRAMYADFGEPARSALAALGSLDEVLHNDIEDCLAPRWSKGRLVLMGDAAHAVTPNLGQGAGLAVEDAAALAEILATQGATDEALVAFETVRRPRAQRIRDRSWNVGRAAQLESPLLRSLRNTLVSWTPDSVARAEMEKIVRDMPGVPVG